jgi:PTH2 family peptidyl-tRNA hydrolase
MSHKQVIVMRKDLNMRKGKMVAQGAHASMAAILNQGKWGTGPDDWSTITINADDRIFTWLKNNFKKVCVYVNSEAELLELHEKAKAAGVITALITDSGLTEFNGVPTNTCIAVGPDTEEKINDITGHLTLL